MTFAILRRMVLPEPTRPFGVHARERLPVAGFAAAARVLGSREPSDAFEAKEDGSTTLQVCMDGRRIGGCEDVEARLAGLDRSQAGTSPARTH